MVVFGVTRKIVVETSVDGSKRTSHSYSSVPIYDRRPCQKTQLLIDGSAWDISSQSI